MDPIGLAGGLNLYGYAGGDPINYHDPFGLSSCKKDATDEEKAECEKTEKAARERYQQAVATCKADFRQAVVSSAASAGVLGLGVYLKSMAAMVGFSPAIAAGGTTGRFVLNSALLGPTMVLGAHDLATAGGSPNPLQGELGLAYAGARMTPFLGMGIQIGEAISSCANVPLGPEA